MGAKKGESSKTARISLFNIQRPNQKAKQREGRGKNSREKEKWRNLFIHHPYTFTIHSETRHQHTVTQSFQNFAHTQTHFTICVNSHSHTHEHKITSTHTPIYNPHAPRAYFRAKSKREERFGFGTTAGVSGGKMVLVEALGERECFG